MARPLLRRPLSRRTLLRGFGTSLALPYLEVMGDAPEAPPRLLWMYVPNGIHMQTWTPEKEGALAGDLPTTLQPLDKRRGELSVLSGLTHHHARANGDGPGDHARAAAVWLTGVQPLKTDGAVKLGTSIDQVVAQELGKSTRFRSLELGCDKGRTNGQCDSGYACAYSGHISWVNETLPAAKETHPAALFDRLFRGGVSAEDSAARHERVSRRKSVLDFVRADARRLESTLGAADRRKLDEFQSGLRELERRLTAGLPERIEDVTDESRPPERSATLGEHARGLLDVLTLAFETDSTRVATFMVANEGSGRAYLNLGVREGHHSISHHGKDEQKYEWLRRIDKYHVELLAHLLERLHERREGSERLLDRTMVVYGSNIADGNRHAHHDLPTILAGGSAFGLKHGVHRRFEKDTPMMNLYLELAARAGVSVKKLGDSTGRLDLS